MSDDPLDASYQERWSDINDGVVYAEDVLFYEDNHQKELGDRAAQDLEDNLSRDWFAIGFAFDDVFGYWAWTRGWDDPARPCINVSYYIPDTEGPYPPGALHMSHGDDTGRSNSDGITYVGNPQFEWTKPADRPDGDNSGTQDFYEWAVTANEHNPWEGPRICDGFTENRYQRSCTLSDGEYKFWVLARDNAGNWGQWAETGITIDTTDPTIPYDLTNPGGIDTTDDTTPNVTWSGRDNAGGSGIWTYNVRFFNGPGAIRTFNSDDTTLDDVEFGGDQLEEGAWQWKVKAVDVAGNDTDWSAARSLCVSLDTAVPAVSDWLVGNDESGNVTVELQASDETGVARVKMEYSIGDPVYDRADWMTWQDGELWQVTLNHTFSDGDTVYLRAWAEDQTPCANSATTEYPENPYTVALAVHLTVDVTTSFQLIDGFGGSFVWMGYAPDDEALAHVLHDLGTTIVRTRGEFWGENWENPGKDWADGKLREILTRVNLADPTIAIMLSFWQPRWEERPDEWHEDNHLKREYYDEWAREIANRVSLMQSDWGVNIRYVSIQNEPDYCPGDDITCCWTPEKMSLFLNDYLAEELSTQDVVILAPEATQAANAANFVSHLSTSKHLGAYNYHIYDCCFGKLSPEQQYTELTQRLTGFASTVPNGAANWQTETSGATYLGADPHGDDPGGTVGWWPDMSQMDKAIAAARLIHLSLTQAESSAFLWWGLTWGTLEPGPEFPEKDRDQGLVLVHHGGDSHALAELPRKKYYAFKQYSKYIRPRYRRVDVIHESPLLVSAFMGPDGRRVVVVIVNKDSAERSLDVELSGPDSYVLMEAYRTDSATDGGFWPVKWMNKALRESVTTLVCETTGPRHTLDVSGSPTDSGSILVDPPAAGDDKYPEGMHLQLTAVAQDGWRFAEWQGHISGRENPATVVMNENKTVTAVFVQCTLSVLVQGEGTVELDPPGGEYACGEEVTICVSPAECFEFDHWEGSVADQGSECTSIIVAGDVTVTAVMEPSAEGARCGDQNSSECDHPDTCDGLGACQANHATDGTSCSGHVCLLGETCRAGVCTGGTPPDCSGTGSRCRADSTCDPNGAEGNCDVRGDPINEGLSCDDSDPCNTGEICQDGSCEGGSAVSCDALDTFCADYECNLEGAEGNCEATTAINEGHECDDDDTCTIGDQCRGGVCQGVFEAEPPSVVWTIPADDVIRYKGCPVDTATIAFSEDVRGLQGAPLGSAQFEVGGLAPAGFGYDGAVYVATISFPGLADGAWHTIRIRGEIEDVCGNKLDGNTSGGQPGSDDQWIDVGILCGDFQQDGDVDVFDRTQFLTAWTKQTGTSGDDLTADFQCDGDVDVFDRTQFLSCWTANAGGDIGPPPPH